MKQKGGLLNDFKLYFEALPNEPKPKRNKPQTNTKSSKKNILDNDIYNGLFIIIAHSVVFSRQRKTGNRDTVLSNIDDRAIMPKVPQPNKKRAPKPKR